MARKKPTITDRRLAGPDHAVLTITGGQHDYRRAPCLQCPWRVDQTGAFPAEAFVISAATAYDMAQKMFACHMAGAKNPATCAGFLLRNSANNLAVRLALGNGRINLSLVEDGGVELHHSYRAMAVANGVDPDEPALAPCRADHE